jgi:hypothetical protein
MAGQGRRIESTNFAAGQWVGGDYSVDKCISAALDIGTANEANRWIEGVVDQPILVPPVVLVMNMSLGDSGGRETANKTKECKRRERILG